MYRTGMLPPPAAAKLIARRRHRASESDWRTAEIDFTRISSRFDAMVRSEFRESSRGPTLVTAHNVAKG